MNHLTAQTEGSKITNFSKEFSEVTKNVSKKIKDEFAFHDNEKCTHTHTIDVDYNGELLHTDKSEEITKQDGLQKIKSMLGIVSLPNSMTINGTRMESSKPDFIKTYLDLNTLVENSIKPATSIEEELFKKEIKNPNLRSPESFLGN